MDATGRERIVSIAAAQQRLQNRAKREDVGPGIDQVGQPLGLLRRHEPRSAQHGAGAVST